MKNSSSNDPSKQDEPSITLQREEVTQVQAPGRHPWDVGHDPKENDGK